jgi:hypothetical protein
VGRAAVFTKQSGYRYGGAAALRLAKPHLQTVPGPCAVVGHQKHPNLSIPVIFPRWSKPSRGRGLIAYQVYGRYFRMVSFIKSFWTSDTL